MKEWKLMRRQTGFKEAGNFCANLISLEIGEVLGELEPVVIKFIKQPKVNIIGSH